MSLHLGNLSSCTRQDELERVFRRFGRCNIQVKGKYGFVVYDYPASAEKALKTLRGKRICGEAITLSWSNRQPQALHRFARDGKAYKPTHKRSSVKQNVDRRLASNDRRYYKMDFNQADGEGRKLGSSDLINESTSCHLDDYVGERDHPSSNDRHGTVRAGNNLLEDDRWGEQVVDPSSENCCLEFDRYEPYYSDDKKESNEHYSVSPFAGSPTSRKSQERRGTSHDDCLKSSDYPYNTKSQKTCYVCGEVGHNMCKCPFDLKTQSSRSRGRLHTGADNVAIRHRERDREPFTSHNHQRFLRHGGSPQRIASGGRRKDFSDKKRCRRDYEVHDKNQKKRARQPSTSSFHAYYTSPRSQSPSRSLESLARSPSHSKSVTLKKNSLSSSKSATSCHSGSKPFKSRSMSRSMSPTLSSLPVELHKHFSPSPNQRQTDSMDLMVNAVGLSHCQDLFAGKTMVRNGARTSISENIACAMENECEAGPCELEDEEMRKDVSEKEDEHCHSVPRGSGPQLHDGAQTADNLFPRIVKERRDSENDDIVGEHMLAPKSDVSLRSNASTSVRMSSEEIYMVLKHYGLQYPEETEKNLPVEIYFGSARSWPWEIIYYRRLKKGPISAKSYSRRISQNEEFGIVDKYVRGSSGWDEMNLENH